MPVFSTPAALAEPHSADIEAAPLNRQWLTVRFKERVRFTPLEVPVILSTAFVGGWGPLPPLPPPQPALYNTQNRSTAIAGANRRREMLGAALPLSTIAKKERSSFHGLGHTIPA